MQSPVILAIRSTVEAIMMTCEKNKQGLHVQYALPLSNGEPLYSTKMDFAARFAHMLMTYEFSLISSTALRVRERFKNMLILGHMHDGLLIYVPEKDLDESTRTKQALLEVFNNELEKTCQTYKFSLPLIFEEKPLDVS